MSYGIDYSFSKPTPAQIKAAGKTFVCRYLSYLPNPKVITKAELQALHAAGIGVVFNWEYRSGDMLKGHDTGVQHAAEAKKQMTALGVPNNIPVYFSCDVNVTTAAQRSAVAGYVLGARSILGQKGAGLYGQYSIIEDLVPDFAALGWQTYAWSGGKISKKANLYQYQNGFSLAGHDVDLDRSLTTDFGAWFPHTPTPPPVRTRTMISLAGFSLPELMQGDDDSKLPGYNMVTRAQSMLNYVTGAKLTVDGIYGKATATAVQSLPGYQSGNGSTIGKAEWATLYGLSKAAAS